MTSESKTSTNILANQLAQARILTTEVVNTLRLPSEEKISEGLVIEFPLAIILNQRPFLTTMRTPGDDVNLVRGLLFSEGIVSLEASVSFLQKSPHEVQVTVEGKDSSLCEAKARPIPAYSGCGICGKIDGNSFLIGENNSSPALESKGLRLNFGILKRAFESLANGQILHSGTGGSHGAAAFSQDGELLALKEDVGRHNAVDKVIGTLIANQKIGEAALLVVSSRGSFEIVQKAYRAKISVVAVVSAVSSLAVQLAEEKGITLLGFCRQDGNAKNEEGFRANVYSHAQRIQK